MAASETSHQKDMFDVLTGGNVLLRARALDETMIMHTVVALMRRTRIENFDVPLGTKEHVDGAPLVMYENTNNCKWHFYHRL